MARRVSPLPEESAGSWCSDTTGRVHSPPAQVSRLHQFVRERGCSMSVADYRAPIPRVADDGPPLAHTPGVATMPPWELGELPDAPKLTAKSWMLLLGPG